MIELSTFRKFPTVNQARELEVLLNGYGIETVLADNLPPVDITFSGSTLQNQYEIQIRKSDFKRAEEILGQNAEILISQVDQDYYLFDFTDEELYEILLNSDEWNEFDYKFAQKLLTERGKPIDKVLLELLKKQRLEILSKPEGNQRPWILTGYALSLLGGFLGIIIGYVIWTSYNTLPNGEKVPSYSLADRTHGRTIFYIGVIIFPTLLLVNLLVSL